ncbi:ABC transporter substrate-binding protein [Candidatus Persebacteraceae bacterium Df01]|jgi:phospholipid transport system substrate-binding protein|uniref:ABC transporter substrate-binding protein n=1 Tax=Candidatus Doriopsillibacter californiensis TaxID=2970740 RepID=A0ABT7QKD4_9GAMM|nr:ABC transporter substrate-binding protein [Candidatus Persebacteraceae bacterium Df01]
MKLANRLITFLAALVVSVSAAATTPKEISRDLETRNNDMLSALIELKQNDALDSDAALALMREEISPLLNFSKITQRALGKHWRRASNEEKKRIIAAFQQLLEKTYAKVLTKYDDQKTEIVKAKQQENGEILVVMNVRGKDKSARIDYLFAGDEPRIIDVKVEGISLIANFRRQFGRMINKVGFDGLAKMLEKMVAQP